MLSIAIGGVVTAALGWITLIVVARTSGPTGYAEFSVYWGYFFAIAAVLFGVQQETARACAAQETWPIRPEKHGRNLLLLPSALGCVVAVAAAGVLALWAPAVSGDLTFVTLACLWMGIVALSAQCAVMGVLAARTAWVMFSTLTAGAAVLRLVSVSVIPFWEQAASWMVAAIVSGSFAWVVAAPTRSVRQALQWRVDFDATSVRAYTSAMIATGCSGLLVAGIPLLVYLTGDPRDDSQAGVLFATIMLTRTPLLLPLNMYSLALLTFLRLNRDALGARAVTAGGIIALIGVVYVAIMTLIGPTALHLLFGPKFVVPPGIVALLAGGAVALLIMTVAGLAVLAQARHLLYMAGWAVATLTTVCVLALPLSLPHRLVAGLFSGPVAGIALYAILLTRSEPASSDSSVS